MKIPMKLYASVAIISLIIAAPGFSAAQMTDNNSCQDPNYTQALNQVHRHWNASLIDHLYTNSADETASGYTRETSGWGVINTLKQNTISLYRYYGSSNTDHFYSTSSTAPAGYVSEGVVGFIFPNEVPGASPLYRLYRHNSDGNGDHLYTVSTGERDAAVNSGYRYETIEGYVCAM